jgi:hypothetical protein
MAAVEDILKRNLVELDHSQLLDTARSFRKAYQDCLRECEAQKEQLQRFQIEHGSQRVLSFPSSISTLDARPSFIRAELDSPVDTTWSCFGAPDAKIIAYELGHGSLRIISRNELLKGKVDSCSLLKRLLRKYADDRGAIYSRLPSRVATTIHVFVESVTRCTIGLPRKFRISTRKTAPPGFIPHWTIHLNQISWSTKFKMLSGQIKWFYILLDPESSKEDCSSLLNTT